VSAFALPCVHLRCVVAAFQARTSHAAALAGGDIRKSETALLAAGLFASNRQCCCVGICLTAACHQHAAAFAGCDIDKAEAALSAELPAQPVIAATTAAPKDGSDAGQLKHEVSEPQAPGELPLRNAAHAATHSSMLLCTCKAVLCSGT
jgi:hypothetical protein